jgi:hypothetical protein
MSPETIPQISLGTAALVIFLICAAFVMLRGLTRMIVGTLVLGLSTWSAFLVWQMAPGWSFEWFGKSIGLITTGFPIAAFLISVFLLRKLARSIVRPFGGPSAEERKNSSVVVRLSIRLLLALVPTTLICLIGATLVHHTGSIAEVRAFAEKAPGVDGGAPARHTHSLKSSVEALLPDSWLRFLDPLADPSRLALAKLIAAQTDSPLEPVIDPHTGLPIPRAIIVPEPELQNLAREGKFGTLLRHPLLTKALEDPKIKTLLKDLRL